MLADVDLSEPVSPLVHRVVAMLVHLVPCMCWFPLPGRARADRSCSVGAYCLCTSDIVGSGSGSLVHHLSWLPSLGHLVQDANVLS